MSAVTDDGVGGPGRELGYPDWAEAVFRVVLGDLRGAAAVLAGDHSLEALIASSRNVRDRSEAFHGNWDLVEASAQYIAAWHQAAPLIARRVEHFRDQISDAADAYPAVDQASAEGYSGLRADLNRPAG